MDGFLVLIFSFGAGFGAEVLVPLVKFPITSELLIVAPSGIKIFSIVPSDGAVTSITTLSVSISARTSSCLNVSPSFFDPV